MPHPVLEAAARYRAALLAQERQAATRLVRAYGRAFSALDMEVRALQEFIGMRGFNATSRADIVRLNVVRSLKAQIAEQVNRYAVVADNEIANAVQLSIRLGLRDSLGMVQAQFTNPRTQAAMAARWDNLPTDAVENMIGFTAPDSPLRERLVGRLGTAVADRVTDALVDAIALGINPRAVAEIMRTEMGQGLTWSLNTARTAQLWSYREASRASYIANRDIVTGWWWSSALDSRTCMSCIANHGKQFPVDAVLNDHHSGRCSPIPIVPLAQRLGVSDPNTISGEQWFDAQPEATQKQMMGPGLWDEWKGGRVSIKDIPRTYVDPVYGEMQRAGTLAELVQESKAMAT